jgi:rfaE bifunctional protein nucleotidyltransferase chain/domain
MINQVEQRNKVINFSDFTVLKSSIKNLRLVQCHGVFDLLHIGHIQHFKTAKRHGDILIVTITPDRYVNKGPGRPYFTENLRADAVAALDCVDYVIINEWPTSVEAIGIIKPNIYVKGNEYQDEANDLTGKINDEKRAIIEVGGEIVFTNEITFSSSMLINKFLDKSPDNVKNFLQSFKDKYSFDSIFNYFEQAKSLKILIIGETIMDEYHFSDAIGKAGKEPILAVKYKSKEVYAGGVLALANHLSEFCAQVVCLTYLGEHAEYEDTIRSCLKPNIELIPIYKKNSPTIVKRRYLDEYLQQKLFEVYEMNDDFLEEDQQNDFNGKLEKLTLETDLSIVADYGHGLLNEESIDTIITKSKFLAVNTQSNASNHGFNCIGKYRRADYVSIASRELQLNYRQKHFSVVEQLNRLIRELDYQTVMVTTGKNGAYICKKTESTYNVPAFTTNVVDRVGAGDAVLAITSLLVYLSAPAELTAFVGNLVGAEAVGIIGNKGHIQKKLLMKHVSHILK